VPHPQGENLKLEKRNYDVDAHRSDGDMYELCKDLRHLQQRTHCTEATILDVLATFEKHLGCGVAGNLRAYDKTMQVIVVCEAIFQAIFSFSSLSSSLWCHNLLACLQDRL
jgi:hypothetical protein